MPRELADGPLILLMHSNLLDRLLLLVVAVVWGLNWVSVKFALQGFPIWTFRTLSFGGGVLILMLAAWAMGVSANPALTTKPSKPIFFNICDTSFGVLSFGWMPKTPRSPERQ